MLGKHKTGVSFLEKTEVSDEKGDGVDGEIVRCSGK
jgi:hypothetical protein